MRSGLLVDTGFFFALHDRRDSRHPAAQAHQHWLDEFPIILPWPILYETVNTRLARRRHLVDIGAMLTFNARDFAALCTENQVEILC